MITIERIREEFANDDEFRVFCRGLGIDLIHLLHILSTTTNVRGAIKYMNKILDQLKELDDE